MREGAIRRFCACWEASVGGFGKGRDNSVHSEEDEWDVTDGVPELGYES